MKVHHVEYNKGILKLEIQNKDDIWYLSQILDLNDVCGSNTTRKIKIGDDENAKVIKKKVFLKISIEKIEFHKYSGDLRLSGKITDSVQDISAGQYHTLNIEEGSILNIKKSKFLNFQRKKLEESTKNESLKILIATIDRGEAHFAILKKYGYEEILSYNGEIEHKSDVAQPKKDAFQEAVDILFDLETKYKSHQIIIGRPSIWSKKISDLISAKSFSSKITYSECNSTGKNAINEVLRRPEIKNVLKNERASKELEFVDDLLKNISKDELYSYGFDDVKQKSDMGAVKILLVSDNFLNDKRNSGDFETLELVMDVVEKTKGEVMVVSSDNDAGKQLDSLSGIAAILRYEC